MTPEQLEQERIWDQHKHECLERMVKRVRQAVAIRSPGMRSELYQSWRKEHGDNVARESAKFAEAVLAGHTSLSKLERML